MTVRVPGPRGAAIRHAQRACGQVTALVGMIDASRPFPEVAQQLLASRGSLDSLLVRLVELELQERVPTSHARQDVDELLRVALGRTAHIRRSSRQRSLLATRPPAQPIERTSP